MKIKRISGNKNKQEANALQELFAREYLVDFNSCAALRRCGKKYKSDSVEKMTACRLLANDNVQAILQRQFIERTKKVEIDIEFVLREIKQIADCDVGQAFKADGTLKSIHDIPTHIRKAIAGFDNEELYEGTGKERRWAGTLRKVKFWDKTKGLEMLGKYLALFVERSRFEDAEGNTLPAVQVNVISAKPQQAIDLGARNGITADAPN